GTRAGVLLGTAGYMSPEQARAQPIDQRTDIWSFGCVLFEMLTGRRLFDGPSVTDTLAAVVRQKISLAGVPADIPPSVVRVLRRCLQRDQHTRLRDIGDARIELGEISPQAAEEPRPTHVGHLHLIRQGAPWILVLLLTAVAVWATRSSSGANGSH